MDVRIRTWVPLQIMIVAAISIPIAVYSWRTFGPQIYINPTASEPLGLYRLIRIPSTEIQRGMLVLFPAPEHLREIVYGRRWMKAGAPLLKEIRGIEGDEICITSTALEVNGEYLGPVAQVDHKGQALPQHPGCFRVAAGSFFPASNRLPNSFDGRYFGALPLTDIMGEAKPLWTF